MLTNYHSHTRWCRHGSGELEEYIKEAIANNLKEYAVTEHIPFPFLKNPCRIKVEEMDDFITELDNLINKYQGQIKILKGLECEYFEKYHDYYIEIKNKYNIDFLILGQHYFDTTFDIDFFQISTPKEIKLYEETVIKAIKSNLFSIVAHPDVFLNSTKFNKQALESTKNILSICEQYQIPVEINANGLRYNRGYPNIDFWKESKNYNLTYLINSDCHNVKDLYDDAINKGYSFAQSLDIEITEFLNFNT